MTTTILALKHDLEPRPRTILTSIETADHMGLSVRILEEMRSKNEGPPYFRLSSGHARKIIYMLDDVQAWLIQNQSKGS